MILTRFLQRSTGYPSEHEIFEKSHSHRCLIAVWFAKTSAGTKNGTVLAREGLNTNLASKQHENFGGRTRVRVERT
jgi:hypothetical protein